MWRNWSARRAWGSAVAADFTYPIPAEGTLVLDFGLQDAERYVTLRWLRLGVETRANGCPPGPVLVVGDYDGLQGFAIQAAHLATPDDVSGFLKLGTVSDLETLEQPAGTPGLKTLRQVLSPRARFLALKITSGTPNAKARALGAASRGPSGYRLGELINLSTDLF